MSKEYKEKEDAAVNPVVETNDSELVDNKEIVGVVVKCSRLNVRKNPDATNKSNILCNISSGEKVIIDEKTSTDRFWAVITSDGSYGFCMKEFIDVIQ